MLSFPAPLARDGAADFLAGYWQKRPLWMPGAIDPATLPDIDANELAWLATLDDVESRLVHSQRHDDGSVIYRMESGPFSEDLLAALPTSDWTLLVQDVEKHLPALRACFEAVPFVPDWRIDDLMISVAAPGGSVGPHVDNYDVFLVQGIGQRNWSWTEQDVAEDPGASKDVRLVAPFDADDARDANPGDVLYLNPGVAHHGVATELCITYSIGMRAPQVSGLAGQTVEGDDAFYSDADLDIAESRPGFLSRAAIERAAALLGRHGLANVDPEQALGRFATSPKDWLTPDPERNMALVEMPLAVHGMARLAWSDAQVFANGRSAALDSRAHEAIEALCRTRVLDPVSFGHWQASGWGPGLLEFLWSAGVFDPEANRQD